jgi:hypothetical protein
MNQPVPNVSEEDVERVVARDFGSCAPEARRLLNEYGGETWHREAERVRLAALRIAGGDLEKLRRAIEVAKSDYRDVLMAAEYPEYGKQPRHNLAAEDVEKVIAEDWKRYSEWFGRK